LVTKNKHISRSWSHY